MHHHTCKQTHIHKYIRVYTDIHPYIRFTRARVKDPLNYSLMGTLIPEASSCKYLGIISRSDLSWVDQVNYALKKAWKALHFTTRILKRVLVMPKV